MGSSGSERRQGPHESEHFFKLREIMRILAILGLMLAIFMSWATTVSAATIIYTDKTAWENALGGQFLTEDFADSQLNLAS